MDVRLVVAGVTGEREAAEHGLKHLLEAAFEAEAGEINIVLTRQPTGYVVSFARAILEHARAVDYSNEVRATLRQAGVAVIGDGVH